MASPTERIKERLSVADVVGEYVQLNRSGKNLKARCPFHSERTPSFIVSPERGTYYCFGCGASGDIFSFIQAFEGLDFRGALEILGRRAGVEITPEDSEKRDERERLYKMLETATTFFEHVLSESPQAQKYLTEERGIHGETIATWRIGYAPAAWRSLHDHLLERGFNTEEMVRAGLIKERNGNHYDIFRGRIMFPIMDAAGRVVAFSGRAFESHGSSNTDDSDGPPKYVNSPETELYTKSEILFGLDKAKRGIRKLGCSIVTEGQVDVVLSHQAGYTNTVGLSGTALTHHQLAHLSRLSENVILALDADAAGATALQRSARRALALGMDVKVAALPDGEDPADIIKEGVERWRECIRAAEHVIDAVLNSLKNEGLDERTYGKEVTKIVLPLVAAIQNKVDQAHFIRRVAARSGIPESALEQEVARVPAEEVFEHSSAAVGSAEDIHHKEPETKRNHREHLERQTLGFLLWQEERSEPEVDTASLRRRLNDIMGKNNVERRSAALETERNALAFELEEATENVEDKNAYVDDLLTALYEEYIKLAYEHARRDLTRAEAEGDTKRRDELLERCQKLVAELSHVHARKQ